MSYQNQKSKNYKEPTEWDRSVSIVCKIKGRSFYVYTRDGNTFMTSKLYLRRLLNRNYKFLIMHKRLPKKVGRKPKQKKEQKNEV